MYRVKRALAFLKHLELSVKVSCEYKSLQEISKGGMLRWTALNTVVRYWLANGLKFTEEDDRFACKAPKAVRAAYAALDGKEPVIKDVNSETGLVLLRVLSPSTPLDEMPLYIGVEEVTVKDYVKARLAKAA